MDLSSLKATLLAKIISTCMKNVSFLKHPGERLKNYFFSWTELLLTTVAVSWNSLLKLPNSWLERAGPLFWAPRSPDLTPLDFFVGGFLKQVVYSKSPETR